jgi:hypothetical protein
MKRSKFNLSNTHLLTCDMGELIPIGATEVVPGDMVRHSTTAFLRCSPLLAPVMHPVDVSIHHWFVPNRIIWDDWESFITGGVDGLDNSAHPTIDLTGASTSAEGTLADYFGIPAGEDATVNALPFRAYAQIWNENYRDQDLSTALTIDTTSGDDTTTNTTLQKVCWQKDYFTTSRPWTQKGAEVTLPLGTTAPVESTGSGVTIANTSDTTSRTLSYRASAGAGDRLQVDYSPSSDSAMIFGNQTGLQTNLSNATSATVNQLFEAFGIQTFEQVRARYGDDYPEYLRHYGVNPQDGRLQRAEYLGGGRQTIQFSEVLQTGVDSSDAGVGTLRGHGIAGVRSNRYRRFIPEHGWVISLMFVRPRPLYTEGLHKKWSRDTKFDYFTKELAHTGQAEVYNREVQLGHTSPDDVFGYQDRYDEYRRNWSSVSGNFGSTLNHWHLGREYSGDQSLNANFVTCSPSKRIFADQSSDTLWIQCMHNMKALRPIPKVGAPRGF